MKLKIIVGTALFIFLIIVGNILLFGLVRTDSQNNESGIWIFFGYYILFSLAIFALIIYLIKNAFEEKSSFIFFIIFGIFVAIALSLAVSSFKIYHENLIGLSQMQPAYTAELEDISQNNGYYAKYSDYLQIGVNILKNNSAVLQEVIDKENELLQKQVLQEFALQEEVQPIDEPAQEYIYSVYENNKEEEEDDD
jgi:hypothetical protein